MRLLLLVLMMVFSVGVGAQTYYSKKSPEYDGGVSSEDIQAGGMLIERMEFGPVISSEADHFSAHFYKGEVFSCSGGLMRCIRFEADAEPECVEKFSVCTIDADYTLYLRQESHKAGMTVSEFLKKEGGL